MTIFSFKFQKLWFTLGTLDTLVHLPLTIVSHAEAQSKQRKDVFVVKEIKNEKGNGSKPSILLKN